MGKLSLGENILASTQVCLTRWLSKNFQKHDILWIKVAQSFGINILEILKKLGSFFMSKSSKFNVDPKNAIKLP